VVPKQRPLAVAIASEDGVLEARVKWRPRQATAAHVRLTDLSDQVLGRECARHRVRRRLLARTRAHLATLSRRRTLAQADIGLSGARGGCPLQQRPSSQLATLHASQSSCIGWTTCRRARTTNIHFAASDRLAARQAGSLEACSHVSWESAPLICGLFGETATRRRRGSLTSPGEKTRSREATGYKTVAETRGRFFS
jgi:hypothetical protein